MSYIMCLSFGKVYFVYTATTALLSTSYITIHKKGLVTYTKKTNPGTSDAEPISQFGHFLPELGGKLVSR